MTLTEACRPWDENFARVIGANSPSVACSPQDSACHYKPPERSNLAAREHFFHGFTKLHRDISQVRKPTIAMINGAAVGSGMDMALHCDIRLGCENTRCSGYQQWGQSI